MKHAVTRSSGFTLIEVMIAMGITAFIIVISTGVHISNLRYFKTTEGRTAIYQDSILMGEYLRNEILGAGGGSVRGWMGIWVEDNCGIRGSFATCAGSDRLTISTTTVPLQECSIVAQLGPGRIRVAESSPGVCCMEPQPASNETTYLGKQVMLVLGDFYLSQYVSAVNLATCEADLTNGQAFAGTFPMPSPPAQNWTGGTITMMNVETIFWNSLDFTLNRWVDANGDNAIQGTESNIVADNIYDMQSSLGYDFSPADGNITEFADGLNDEWLFNNPTAIETYNAGFFIAPITRAAMQMVSAGVIVGAADTTASMPLSNIRLLNGPIRSRAGWILQEELARVAPRNSFVFQ